jgi:hypothetical protein
MGNSRKPPDLTQRNHGWDGVRRHVSRMYKGTFNHFHSQIGSVSNVTDFRSKTLYT